MTIKELQKIISSATTVKVFVAKSKADADNEVSTATYRMDVYSCIAGMEDWVVEYIYPRTKDELEAWCVIEGQQVKKIKGGIYRVYGSYNERTNTEVRYARKADAESYMYHRGGYLVYEDFTSKEEAQKYLDEKAGRIWW